MAAYRRVDDLSHLRADRLTACTAGSAPGPTLGNEYGKPFFLGIISQYTAPIYTKFLEYVQIWMGMINAICLRSLRIRCDGNRFWRELATIGIRRFHSVRCHSTTDGKIATRQARINTADNPSTCDKNLENFG